MPRRLTVTVGPDTADLPGFGRASIQAAVDMVHQLGGGTVRLLPGRYELRNAVLLRSGVRLEGAGDETHLIKAPETVSALAEDSDWYEAVVRVGDPDGFRVGDGIVLEAEPIGGGSAGGNKVKTTVVDIEGPRLYVEDRLDKNFWVDHQAVCSTRFPLIWIERQHDCAVASLRLDGNRDQNGLLDGNHAGCIFMQYADRVTVENVTAHHYHGDGISWQVADDVSVIGCRCHDNANLGLHPGSGSQRPIIRDNHCHHNDIGLFYCWGVRHGVAEGNRLEDNRSYGISIGHRDTDNLIRDNDIARNGKVGVWYRPEQPATRLPHRNVFEANRILDNGADEEGVGFWLRDRVEGTVLRGNRFGDSGQGVQKIGLRIDAEVPDLTAEDNAFQGLAQDVEDRR